MHITIKGGKSDAAGGENENIIDLRRTGSNKTKEHERRTNMTTKKVARLVHTMTDITEVRETADGLFAQLNEYWNLLVVDPRYGFVVAQNIPYKEALELAWKGEDGVKFVIMEVYIKEVAEGGIVGITEVLLHVPELTSEDIRLNNCFQGRTT
jgi:hypothetical protein